MANTDNLDLKRLDGPKTTKFDYDLYVENNFEKVDAAMGAPPSTLTTEAKTLVPAIIELQSDKVDKETGKGLSTNDFDNTYKQKIDEDIPAQLNDKANKVQEAWITPTLLNGWTLFLTGGTDMPQYYKDDFGLVHLRGRLRNGTSNLPAFILPAGYRPSQPNSSFSCPTRNGTIARTDISSNGEVRPVMTVTTDIWIDLAGVTFRT